jgi:hypothetical protein
MSENEPKELEWGETIWDDMTKEELLRECQRMYSALIATGSVVEMYKAHDPNSPYWSLQGVGGRALAKYEQVMKPIIDKWDTHEPMYRVFFRYANDLLFTDVGSGWVICDTCGAMWGGHVGRVLGDVDNSWIGQPCNGKIGGKPGCTGTIRNLEWSDLDKQQERP